VSSIIHINASILKLRKLRVKFESLRTIPRLDPLFVSPSTIYNLIKVGSFVHFIIKGLNFD